MFASQFDKYADMQAWDEGERQYFLGWCLLGKASEFYALTMDTNEWISYRQLMANFERQFGFSELPETARVTVHNAHQSVDEPLFNRSPREVRRVVSAEDEESPASVRTVPKTTLEQQADTLAAGVEGISKKIDLILEKIAKPVDQQATVRSMSHSPSRDLHWFRDNRKGHMQSDWPSQSSPARSQANADCFLCDPVGHCQRDCLKASSAPRWKLEGRSVASIVKTRKRQRVEGTGLTLTHVHCEGLQLPSPTEAGWWNNFTVQLRWS